MSSTTSPIISVRPVIIPAPDRGVDLQVSVSAPTTGVDLPVVVFAHGFGHSMNDYAPLADAWASSGFVVIQPTLLDSHTLGLTPADPRYPEIWRIRVEDVTRVVDSLDLIEAAVPGLAGRVSRSRIAAAGHSWGGQTVGMLLGARVLDADGIPGDNVRDPRITAGVLLATTGTGEDLTPFAAENFAFMRPDFTGLTTSTLVVAGDADQSMLSTRGPDWFTDVYRLSPGATDLLTVAGGEHSLGGITGYGVTATTDENPERVALIQRVTTAWLRTALKLDDAAWPTVRAADAAPVGRTVSK
ncbi:alpha/beta hydrolase family protein [Geodermatophilus sp. FMUSA9-8]|uniref:alpha/beta hydrolase family protein n=1 Tax=Geodermatophilus sp. FMUSA9-8 TaxID=3120155 RepID=UPI00300A5F54